MKKIYFLLLLVSGLLVANASHAHPGRTASDGGHYCRTNCDSWGEAYGVRHFHGGYTPDYSAPRLESVACTPYLLCPPDYEITPVNRGYFFNAEVPYVVAVVFNDVFGRKPEADESTYWKKRARTDKTHVTKLQDTMKYFRSRGWTYGN